MADQIPRFVTVLMGPHSGKVARVYAASAGDYLVKFANDHSIHELIRSTTRVLTQHELDLIDTSQFDGVLKSEQD